MLFLYQFLLEHSYLLIIFPLEFSLQVNIFVEKFLQIKKLSPLLIANINIIYYSDMILVLPMTSLVIVSGWTDWAVFFVLFVRFDLLWMKISRNHKAQVCFSFYCIYVLGRDTAF